MEFLAGAFFGAGIGLVIGVNVPDRFYVWPPRLWGKRPSGDGKD